MVEVTLSGESYTSWKRSESVLQWATTGIASLVVVFAVSLFFGFEFTLGRAPAALVPGSSGFGAALLMISAVGVIAVSSGRRAAATIIGILILVAGMGTVLGPLLRGAFDGVPASSALAFAFIGLSLVVVVSQPGEAGSYAAGVASVVVFLSGAVSLIQRSGGFPTVLPWSTERGISPEIAVGLLVLSFAIAGLGFARNKQCGGKSLPVWFPFTASVSAFGATVAIWEGMRSTDELSGSPYPGSVLVFGTISCALLAVSLYLWRHSDERAAAATTANTQLQDVQRRLEYILDGTNVGTWEWDVPGGSLLVNTRWESMLGLSVTMTGMHGIDTWFATIHRGDLNRMHELLRDHFEGELPLLDLEIRVKRPDGQWIWTHVRGKVATWTDQGKPELMSGTVLDVTRRKRAELSNASALKEKESLLRELQHRTKNNLNMIAGLLSLQSIHSSNAELKKALTAVKSRISAMGVLYGQLQEAEDLGSVDLGEYLTRLTTALGASLGGDRVTMELNMDPHLPRVTHSQAVYVGILVNEVVTNSLKYAFPDGREGVVSVSLAKAGPTGLELVVEDNGIGFVLGESDGDSTSMGLELSRMLAEEQLKGSYRCVSGNGVRHIMEFELDPERAPSKD